MKTNIPPWISYTVLRLLFFLVPFGLMMIFMPPNGDNPWPGLLAELVIASVIAFVLSYLLLGKLRRALATDIHKARTRTEPVHTADDDFEDAIVDEANPEYKPSVGNVLDRNLEKAREQAANSIFSSEPKRKKGAAAEAGSEGEGSGDPEAGGEGEAAADAANSPDATAKGSNAEAEREGGAKH